MIYLGLLTGFAILLVSGDFLVRGAVVLAERLGVPVLLIGLTVVAFGTSAPELVVSIRAILADSPGIALGNIVGSNIANVLLVLGIPALLCPTDCNQPFILRNMSYVVAASVLFIALCYFGPLDVWHGALMFGLIILFLVESGRRAGANPASDGPGDSAIEEIDGVAGLPTSNITLGVFFVVGLVGLPVGAELIVNNGTDIARTFQVSEAAIGLTIIAFGTSLPELATTLAAAIRGHCGLAIGNVLGSNLFNILAIMGITAIVAPVSVPEEFLRFDLWIMLAATLALVPFVLSRRQITRIPAALFVGAYAAYIYVVLTPKMAEMTTQIQ